MDGTWHALQFAALPPASPQLFVKARFTSTSYTLFLTDLSRVWNESLDRRQVLRRALDEDTSIDPTEDAEQLRLLLQYVKSAVDGETRTRRQLARRNNTDSLTLRLTTPLPGPLADLQWTVLLRPLPPESLRKHLVSPLMSKAHQQKAQIDELIGHLGAKDQVISKLLDKLEASGMDISSVFPGTAGIKGSKHAAPREQAARQVHGLGVFDVQQWQHRTQLAQSVTVPFGKVLPEAFSVSSPIDDEDDHPAGPGSDWLSKLPTGFDETVDGPAKIRGATDGDGDMTDQTGEDNEDSFERQETPPRLRKAKTSVSPRKTEPAHTMPTTAHPDTEDETTDDDDLDDGPSQRPEPVQPPREKVPSSSAASQSMPSDVGKSRKLGTLGGRAPKPMHDRTSESKASGPDSDDTKSETEDEDELDSAQPRKSSAQPTSSAPKPEPAVPLRKGKLGVLGGSRKAAGDTEGSISPIPAPQSSPEATAPSGRVRSKIGGRKVVEPTPKVVSAARQTSAALDSASPAKGQAVLGNEAGVVPTPSAPPESEQQRANRKREELRRELEAKSGGPKKKKRRF